MANYRASHPSAPVVIITISCVLMMFIYMYMVHVTEDIERKLYTSLLLQNMSTSSGCSTSDRLQHIEEVCKHQNIFDSKYLDHTIVDDRHRVLYCFIPKVGCTSFKSMFVKNFGIETNRAWYNVKYLHSIGIKQLLKYSEKDISKRLQNYFKFMVVRHPFDRLVSAYKQKFGGLASSHNFATFYTKVIKNHFGHIEKVDKKGRTLISWNQFLELVATETKKFYNIHWATYEHLCNPCLMKYNHVVYMETIDDDIDPVLDHLKNPDRPRPTLPGRNVVRNSTDNMARLLKKFRNINPDILQRLLEIYANDFKLFGYTWDSESGAGCTQCRC